MLDSKSNKVLNYLKKCGYSQSSIAGLKARFPKYDIDKIYNYLVELDFIKNNNGHIIVNWKGMVFKEMYFHNSLEKIFWTLISVLIGYLLGK